MKFSSSNTDLSITSNNHCNVSNRGFAHVGVINKMTEKKVPIDMVGGTSMGSFVGAIYSMCTNTTEMQRMAEAFRSLMTTPVKYTDLNIPYVSFTSGECIILFFSSITGYATIAS